MDPTDTIGWPAPGIPASRLPRGDLRAYPADSHTLVTPDQIDGPHRQPQHEQRRVAAPGRAAVVSAEGVALSDGGSTLLAIRWRRPGSDAGWALYLDTDPKRALFITDTDLAPFIQGLVKG